jgi:hypothetical protein
VSAEVEWEARGVTVPAAGVEVAEAVPTAALLGDGVGVEV